MDAHTPTGPGGHVQGVEHEGGVHAAGRLPAHDAPGEDVDDEGDVDDARPCRAVGEVGHPGSVWAGGGEVPAHQVRGPHRRRVRLGCEALLGSGGADDALLGHEPGDLVTTDVEPCAAGRLGQFASAIDGVVLLPQGLERRCQFGVTQGPGRRRPALGVVVGGGGDLQHSADRLDPPSTPTGRKVPVGVDEGDYLFGRPSSSVMLLCQEAELVFVVYAARSAAAASAARKASSTRSRRKTSSDRRRRSIRSASVLLSPADIRRST